MYVDYSYELDSIMEILKAYCIYYNLCYLDHITYILAFNIRSAILKSNDWALVKFSTIRKVTLIVSNVRILSYFLVSIIFVGAAGIWLPWLYDDVKYQSFFRGDNVFTFVLALLGGLLCNKVFHADRIVKDIFKDLKILLENKSTHSSDDIITILNKRKSVYREQLALSAIGFVIGSVSLVLVIIGYAGSSELNNIYSFLGMLISLLLYIFSNAEEIDDSTKVEELSEDENPSGIYDAKIPKPYDLFKDAK